MFDAICEVVRDVIDVDDLGAVVVVPKREPLRPTTAPLAVANPRLVARRRVVLSRRSTRHEPREIDDVRPADAAGASAALPQ